MQQLPSAPSLPNQPSLLSQAVFIESEECSGKGRSLQLALALPHSLANSI